MEPTSKNDEVHSSPISCTELKTENSSYHHTSFYFNPGIYFPCKLCRNAFSTVDSLLTHKRRKHTVAQLKSIKFIIFEERFVKDEFYSAITLPQNGDSCGRIKTEVQQGTNSEVDQEKRVHDIENEDKRQNKTTEKFNETESKASSLSSSDLMLSAESQILNSSLSKSNPFVLLLRMTDKEIQDAKNSLKNPASKKRASEFNFTDNINSKTKRANVLEVEKPNLNETLTPFLSSSPEKSNLESGSTEFISLDIISKGDGLREITFSTFNELTTDQYQHPLQEPELDSTAKPEHEELSPPESTNSFEQVQIPEHTEPLSYPEHRHPLREPKPEQAELPQPKPGEIAEEESITEITEYTTTQRKKHLVEEQEDFEDDPTRCCSNSKSYREYCRKFERLFYVPRGIKKSQDPTQSGDEGNADDDESLTDESFNSEPEANKSCAKNTTVESESPLRKYSTRECTKARKNYADPDPEELKCSKCSKVYFTQNEFEDHLKLQCKETVLSENPESIVTVVAVASETDRERSETSVENSDAEDKASEDDNAALIPKICENESKSRLTGKNSSSSKDKTTLSNSGVNLENGPNFATESAPSFKEWLKTYKKDFPESLVFLDPDPLLEPEPEPGPSQDQDQDQRQGQDEIAAGTGTETVLFPLRCKLCKKKLQSEDLAKEHVMTCWRYKKKSHSYCLICDKTFENRRALKNHNQSKHREPGQEDLRPKVKCPTCGKEFMTGKNRLKLHMITHGNPESLDRNFVCEICGSSFFTKESLYRHIKGHSNERPFACMQCPLSFRNKNTLMRHKRIHLNVTFPCSLCDKKYSTLSYLNYHTRWRHTGEKPFDCLLGNEKCPLKFSTQNQMKSHCRKEHPETLKTRKFPCTLCSKTLSSNASLKQHMMTHTGVRPFKCTHEGCPKAYSMKSNLVEHMRTHTGEKPFQCDGCGVTYWKHFSLVKHCKVSCRNKTLEAEMNKLPCHLCPRKFQGKWELNRHLKLHEEGRVSADGSVRARGGAQGKVKGNRKELECQVCDFKCGAKMDLKEHEKTHDESEDEDEVNDDTPEEEQSGDGVIDNDNSESSASDSEAEEYVVEGVEVE